MVAGGDRRAGDLLLLLVPMDGSDGVAATASGGGAWGGWRISGRPVCPRCGPLSISRLERRAHGHTRTAGERREVLAFCFQMNDFFFSFSDLSGKSGFFLALLPRVSE